jgi:hypothetical protein
MKAGAIVYAMVRVAAAAALTGDDMWAACILGARAAVAERGHKEAAAHHMCTH